MSADTTPEGWRITVTIDLDTADVAARNGVTVGEVEAEVRRIADDIAADLAQSLPAPHTTVTARTENTTNHTTQEEAMKPERPTEGNLAQHAWDELDRAGMFDDDSDYNGALGADVLALVRAFAAQGHSGASAAATLSMLGRLLAFEPLSDLTDDPAEWLEVTDGLWQSRRMSEAFSRDGGRTYTRNSTRSTVYTSVRKVSQS